MLSCLFRKRYLKTSSPHGCLKFDTTPNKGIPKKHHKQRKTFTNAQISNKQKNVFIIGSSLCDNCSQISRSNDKAWGLGHFRLPARAARESNRSPAPRRPPRRRASVTY
ncbi:unnamed protein product [Chrysodeixis includens]|uniref:Uncharacterized protein n=1 Tax=Chrysodeixis includens TaxID=689277 RepID=A0A9P0BP52_CHRIL|nr:unnamed protein product [Chrysodeixis includens]